MSHTAPDYMSLTLRHPSRHGGVRLLLDGSAKITSCSYVLFLISFSEELFPLPERRHNNTQLLGSLSIT